MSKSRYLKASELKLSHKELRAFIWVKKLLLNNTLEEKSSREKPFRFDIGETVSEECNVGHWCGTAACIGGWVGLKLYAKDPLRPTEEEIVTARDYVMGKHASFFRSRSIALYRLFYENLGSKARPVDAAAAINHYLTTGIGR